MTKDNRYNVPEDWSEVYGGYKDYVDFEGDQPILVPGPLIGWMTPDGFVSPDKLLDQFRVKVDNRLLDADGSGRLLPEKPVQSNPGQINQPNNQPVLSDEEICRLEKRVMISIGTQEAAALGKRFFAQAREANALRAEVERLKALLEFTANQVSTHLLVNNHLHAEVERLGSLAEEWAGKYRAEQVRAEKAEAQVERERIIRVINAYADNPPGGAWRSDALKWADRFIGVINDPEADKEGV